MSEDSQGPQAIIRLVPLPYAIVDVSIAQALEGLIHLLKGGRQSWIPSSAGSGRHMFFTPKGVLYLIIESYAVSLSESIVSIQLDEGIKDTNPDILTFMLKLIMFNLDYESKHAAELRAQQPPLELDQDTKMLALKITAGMPETKRPGPAPKPYTAWAREQARNDRKLDDPTFLDEYMQQRGEDPSNEEQRKRAYETLRRTLRRS